MERKRMCVCVFSCGPIVTPTPPTLHRLCVAPRHVDRDEFFAELEVTLREQPEVKELAVCSNMRPPLLIRFSFFSFRERAHSRPAPRLSSCAQSIPEAYVPIIKMKFDSVSVKPFSCFSSCIFSCVHT